MPYALILDKDFSGSDSQVTVVKLDENLEILRAITRFNSSQMGGNIARDGLIEVEPHPLQDDASPATSPREPATIYRSGAV